MRISVIVKSGRSKESIEEIEKGVFMVSVSARAQDGKANEAVRKMIAEYFHIALSCVSIEKGKTSRKKIINLLV
ncbi:MAG: DUF167 domain-containing protein [Candidatus Moranbacteria bacterium]|nr:DUF167 domain-containing protein [Candidatus Moranbacteria bacterium]